MAITAHGLDEVFGPVSLHAAQSATGADKFERVVSMANSGWLQDLAQQRLHVWMGWGAEQARLLVSQHMEEIRKLSYQLYKRKTLSNAEVRAILGAGGSTFVLGDIPLGTVS